MKIEYLADHPRKHREVAELHYGQWPELGDSVDAREQSLAMCCRRGEIPLGVVALDQDELCGFALLVPEDFEMRPNLSPWLAGVFVRPRHRRKGVGAALVTRIESEAKALNVEMIYLYTAHSEALYARLGWIVIERCAHEGRTYAVMAKRL
jgi:predicted N-acetyltransferase YhbS